MTRSATGRGLRILLGVGLSVLVLAVYAQVRGYGFVNMDDQQYVYENAYVLRGLTWDGVRYASTALVAANWHPLTCLSHMVDVAVFGVNAGGHHLVNVLLHLLNTVILFVVLVRATAAGDEPPPYGTGRNGYTGAAWRSAAVAALFAVHPLHVESVAWISERKDVLSTLFFLLAIGAYVAYTRRPGPGRYLSVVGLFALGLLSKPMVVTLPFVLLLLDGWPLGRLCATAVREKIPLFALSAVSCVVTYLAQAKGGARMALAHVPLGARIANALVSYALYLEKMVWPVGLAAFYPHPAIANRGTPWWHVAVSALVLAGITLVALRERRRRPYIAWGWFWYLGTLVPVIGLVQVGVQAMADRYTYVPLIGPFVAMVWAGADLVERWRIRRELAWSFGTAVVLALSVASWIQVRTWRDSFALHSHALEVTERNWNAWMGLADAYSEAGRYREAIAADQEALRIVPDFAAAWNGLGATYGRLGQHEEAILHFEQALRLKREYPDAWYNLGTAHGVLGRHEQAAACFREALRLRPHDPRAWANLGIASLVLGDRAEALESYRQLQHLDPSRAEDLRRRIVALGN